MSIPGSAEPLLLTQSGGYQIERSLRFNSSDSAYLSRSYSSSPTDRTKQTISFWAKFSNITSTQRLFWGYDGSSNEAGGVSFISSQIYFSFGGSSTRAVLTTPAVFRDPSAWYHILIKVDSTTTDPVTGHRVAIFVNGVQQATGSDTIGVNALSQFGLANSNNRIGCSHVQTDFTAAYLAEVYFIDGQALTPSSFAETNATTGQWVPKAYTGTYGTNGFRLDFSDNSAATATTLGKDRAGSNNWTPNNLSVTAGAGNDSLVDTPTSGSQVDTGLGGQVTGNYCTLNPLANPGSSTLSNGNLDVVTASASYGKVNGTIAVSSGKWYWEVVCTVKNQDAFIGIEGVANANSDTYTGGSATGTGWYDGGSIYSNASSTSYGTTYAVNDVIGVALNMDAGTLVFYKNGVSAGTAKTGLSGSFTASVSDGATSGSGNTYVCNFGQRAFAYTAPSGFKALCDTNLPAPVVAKPNTAMDVALYTGTGSARSITGLGFSPDFVWIKSRSGAFDPFLYDSIRGTTKALRSQVTNGEETYSQGLTAFNSDGFSVGTDGEHNSNGQTFVAWTWDAGSSTVTNTQGSITSQVRANASAGFSIVTYTGNGTKGATIGHGLGVGPQFVICKRRDAAEGWWVGHVSPGWTTGAYLHVTDGFAATSNDRWWNNTAPTSSVITLGTYPNTNTGTYVCYAFAPVAGYSAFGSYTGNNSADGPFQWCGFRPRWLLIKSVGYAADWIIIDAARETYNVMQKALFPNRSYFEAQASTALRVDFLSNGFKIRSTDGNAEGWNYPSNSHVWAAFAENPFQYARAR